MSRESGKKRKSSSPPLMESLEARWVMSAVPLALPALTARESFDAPIAQISGVPDGAAAPAAVIRWGGGGITVVRATPLSGSPGEFVAWAPHRYRRAGTRLVSIVFREHGKVLGRVYERVTVAKPTVAPSSQGSTGTPAPAGDDQRGATAPAVAGTRWQGVLGTLSFPTPPSATTDLSFIGVRIDWGDGTMSKGALAQVGPDQFQITGAHTYASPGTYAVRVAAKYGGRPLMPIPGEPEIMIAELSGAYAALDATFQVSGAPVTLPPAAVQITGQALPTAYADAFDGTLATMTGISPDPLGADVYAVVDWGGGSLAGPLGINVQYQNGQYVVSGFRRFSAINRHNTSTTASGTFDVTVTLMLNDHADPAKNTVLGTITDHLTVLPNSQGGVTLNLAAGQTFSGWLGTVTLDPTRTLQVPAIDWGDGSAPDTQVTLTPIGNNQFDVTATHTYASADRYRISLSVTYAATPPQPGYESVQDLLVSTAIVS